MRLPRVSLIALISLLSFATAVAAPGARPAAQTACPNNSCHVFLPLINWSAAPQLIAPVNGFASPTLAPTLSFMPTTAGTYKIQVSSDPQFVPGPTMPVSITKKLQQPPPFQVDTTISSNLLGQTLYYWRVGAPLAGGYVYSPVFTFVTPVRNPALLPAVPTILSPRNNSRIKGSKVTLRWQAVPGAITYRIRVSNASGRTISSDELEGQTDNLTVEGVPPGTYHWRIKALNGHGWSSYSDDFYFTLY